MSAAERQPEASGAATAAPGNLPTIYFVRHGETDWNAEGRLQGHRDTHLNATGRRQAQQAALALRDMGVPVERLAFLASPLSRTRETMALLRAGMGLPPDDYATDARLTEISFGRWEGRTWREIKGTDQRLYAQRRAAVWDFVPPGGESYAQVAARIAPLLAELRGDCVMVAHGGVARAITTLACGVPHAEAVHLDIWQGRVLTLRAGAYGWSEPGR